MDMYIRSTSRTDKNTKKKYVSYQLVESVRTSQGPRQNVLLTLDKNFQLQPEDHKLLVRRLKEIMGELDTLTKMPERIERVALHMAELLWQKSIKQTPQIAQSKRKTRRIGGAANTEADFRMVDVNHIQHPSPRSIGAEYVAYHAYQLLGLSKKLGEMGLSAQQNRLITALIISRAINPASEHATWHWLRKKSGLHELLGCDFEFVPLYRFYEAADSLLSRKKHIEKFLVESERSLFKLEETIILYDITNTFFEGGCFETPKAKRGKSKENRVDRPLVSLGVVLDGDGFPKQSEMFAGNVGEAQTFRTMILRFSNTQSNKKPIVVMDSGIASKNNIEWLKEQGYGYVVMMKKKFRPAKEFTCDYIVSEDLDHQISVSIHDDAETGDSVLYCYSLDRERKEIDIKDSTMRKLEDELNKLKLGLGRKRSIKSYDKVHQKLGRLHQRYTRIYPAYDIKLTASQDEKTIVDMNWTYDKNRLLKSFSGTYCLRTNVKELEPKKLWEIYMMLSEAEALFRCIKSEAGLRPIYHKREDRIESHIFISLLAYHLIATIRRQLKENGINLSWESVRNELKTHESITSILKTQGGETIATHSSSEPTPMQRKIYSALALPTRPIAYKKTITKAEEVVSESR
jgi:transposase